MKSDTTGAGLLRWVLPLRLPMSGPKMISTASMSVEVSRACEARSIVRTVVSGMSGLHNGFLP